MPILDIFFFGRFEIEFFYQHFLTLNLALVLQIDFVFEALNYENISF